MPSRPARTLGCWSLAGWSDVSFAGCCAARLDASAIASITLVKIFMVLSLSSIADFLRNMHQVRYRFSLVLIANHWRLIRMALRDHLFARSAPVILQEQTLLLRQRCGRGKNRWP